MQRRRRLTAAEREDRRRRDRERLEEAARELLTSEGWQRWVAIRRHNGLARYSLGNQLLIAVESGRRGPPATYVVGYRWWAQHGYNVRRGEKAIRILAPIRRLVEDADGEECLGVVGFRAVAVFDRSQVDPGPDAVELEPPREPLTGDSHAAQLGAVEQLLVEIGCSVSYEEIPGATNGYYRAKTGEVAIEASLAANAKLRTLFHEAAHALIDRTADVELSYEEEEVMVETAGHVAAGAVGLDTTGEAVSYLASWGEDGALDAVRRSAELIDRTARRLEDAVRLAQGSEPEGQPASA